MKLRLTESMLRLRLAPSDVKRFRTEGRLVMMTRFGPGAALAVALEADPTAAQVTARLDGPRLTVAVPQERAQAWADSEVIGLEAEQPVGAESSLTILVEKDLQCLHRDADARRADAFPHPADDT